MVSRTESIRYLSLYRALVVRVGDQCAICVSTGGRTFSNTTGPFAEPKFAEQHQRRLQEFDVREFVQCTGPELASSITGVFAPFFGPVAASLQAALGAVSSSVSAFSGCPNDTPSMAGIQAMLDEAVGRLVENTETTVANRVSRGRLYARP